ncbi:MAG: AAA family ATPase [Candidatus Dormibacteria bacterium]
MVLLAGEAKVGKTFAAAQFSGDDRLGRCFWLDLGEGCADEYGAVPGANYEILEHDGSWIQIIEQVEAVRDVARDAIDQGDKPVGLVIDSMTAEWAMLSAWTDQRARRSANNRKALEANPDAEIDISPNYWNDANSRHNRLMNILKTAPMVTVMTTLETEKTQFGPNGKPIPNAPKEARPDAQKRIAADSTAWIRLSHDHPPTVIGIRSVKHNVQPGVDKPRPWPKFTLGGLVFDVLKVGTETVQVRDAPELNADHVADGEQAAEVMEGVGADAAQRDAARSDRGELLEAVCAGLASEQKILGDSPYESVDRVVRRCKDLFGVDVGKAPNEDGVIEDFELSKLDDGKLRFLLGVVSKSISESRAATQEA